MLITTHPSQEVNLSQRDLPASLAPARESAARGSPARETQSSPPAAFAIILPQGSSEKYLPAVTPPPAPRKALSHLPLNQASDLGSCYSILQFSLVFLHRFPAQGPPKAPSSFKILCLKDFKPRGHSWVILGTVARRL